LLCLLGAANDTAFPFHQCLSVLLHSPLVLVLHKLYIIRPDESMNTSCWLLAAVNSTSLGNSVIIRPSFLSFRSPFRCVPRSPLAEPV
jgi:hypothetical protein